jgi:predicted amidohydrolase
MEKRDLKISLLQSELFWEERSKNYAHLASFLAQIDQQTDLIILPETFATAFSMNPERVAEPSEGPSLSWMQEWASKTDAAVSGSIVVEDAGNYYNRLFFVMPDGFYVTYDKRHLFGMMGEDKVFSAGKQKLLVQWRDWMICPMICYDLRFPAWNRNMEDFDFMYFVANWPDKRIAHWNTLLQARAIENQVYCAGVNRFGTDKNGIEHHGHSSLYDPQGEKLFHNSSSEELVHLTLSAERIKVTREKLPFLLDRDRVLIAED